MPVYKLTIEYDGTKFRGWQVQREGRTVQGVLLGEIRDAVGDPEVTLQGAGRTDAGVHALGQVASLSSRRPIDTRVLLQRLEERLPADLAVIAISPAPARFHARHDAVLRSYRYQLARRRSAFGKRVTWWVREALDIDAMLAAASAFVGRHDYRAMSRSDPDTGSTEVAVDQVKLVECGEYVLLRFIASHFLWGQVRRMTGALVAVGAGRARAADVPRWLDGTLTPPQLAAPASGLFLEAVLYRGDDPVLPPLQPVGVPGVVGGGCSGRPRAAEPGSSVRRRAP